MLCYILPSHLKRNILEILEEGDFQKTVLIQV